MRERGMFVGGGEFHSRTQEARRCTADTDADSSRAVAGELQGSAAGCLGAGLVGVPRLLRHHVVAGAGRRHLAGARNRRRGVLHRPRREPRRVLPEPSLEPHRRVLVRPDRCQLVRVAHEAQRRRTTPSRTSTAPTRTSTRCRSPGSLPASRTSAYHRFQHIYMWALYGLFTFKFHLGSDVGPVFSGKIGQVATIAKPTRFEMFAARGRQGGLLDMGGDHPAVLPAMVGRRP